MTNRERHACYNLAITMIAVAVFVAALFQRGVGEAMVAFTLLALWGLGPILFLGKSSSGGGVIHRRASKHGMVAASICIAASTVVGAVAGFPSAMMVAFVLTGLLTWIAFVVVHGLSTLAQSYRQRSVA